MTEVNVSATVGMSTTVGEMSATVGEMSATVGELNKVYEIKLFFHYYLCFISKF